MLADSVWRRDCSVRIATTSDTAEMKIAAIATLRSIWPLRRTGRRSVGGGSRPRSYISPRWRRMAYHFWTLALCCSNVFANTWPPVPSATK